MVQDSLVKQQGWRLHLTQTPAIAVGSESKKAIAWILVLDVSRSTRALTLKLSDGR